MVLTALRGAVGFLTRIPVGHDGDAWEAFQRAPVAFPAVGYLVGGLAALPLLGVAVLPASTVAAVAVVWLYTLTGITHLDGVADLGDAAVVHGDPGQRVEVLKDTVLGVGGTVALGVVLLAVALGFLGLAATPIRIAVAVVVASEVGAKLSMAGVACLGTARHEGLGSAFTTASGPRSLLPAVVVALPAGLLAWPSPVAAVALVGAVAGGALVSRWANGLVGGVNGDVFGAANELARLTGLHVGVVAWTLS
ncbi:adenosylcobinamide-GDP ribazoletransferase [Halorarius litoreus]|uniref:adenosylcobinamide-GDP ribazoletransferase n=1 Tax=Halorarius litoreus TaxID=2962676 RepID=UPI0020CF8DFC|nr:adenosylcobinamide-GDP ribazoletransferase [Halorarius litoreus]